MMDKKKLRQKLIEALRSDEYTQGTGRLKYENKDGKVHHCCLGVACEIYIKENPHITFKKIGETVDNEAQFIVYSLMNSIGGLPTVVTKAFGFNTGSGAFTKSIQVGETHYSSLMDCNDNKYTENGSEKRMTFAQIADLIEKNGDKIWTENN